MDPVSVISAASPVVKSSMRAFSALLSIFDRDPYDRRPSHEPFARSDETPGWWRTCLAGLAREAMPNPVKMDDHLRLRAYAAAASAIVNHVSHLGVHPVVWWSFARNGIQRFGEIEAGEIFVAYTRNAMKMAGLAYLTLPRAGEHYYDETGFHVVGGGAPTPKARNTYRGLGLGGYGSNVQVRERTGNRFYEAVPHWKFADGHRPVIRLVPYPTNYMVRFFVRPPSGGDFNEYLWRLGHETVMGWCYSQPPDSPAAGHRRWWDDAERTAGYIRRTVDIAHWPPMTDNLKRKEDALTPAEVLQLVTEQASKGEAWAIEALTGKGAVAQPSAGASSGAGRLLLLAGGALALYMLAGK